jgi:hypothetical protein
MSKYISINIPEGCTQDWNMMEQRSEGKHCNSCQKTVIDFTLMTDTQLAKFFKKSTSNVCGRFYDDQLDRQITIPKRELPWLKYFFTITLPAFLFSQKSWGQKKNINDDTVLVEKKVLNESLTNTSISSRILKGIIVDDKGNPVSFASVLITGSRKGTSADKNGNFIIKLNENENSITISAIGFTTQILEYLTKKNHLIVKLNSRNESGYLGFVVSTKVKKKTSKKNTPIKSDFNAISIFPNPILQNTKLNINWLNKINSLQIIEIFNTEGAAIQKETIHTIAPTQNASIILKQIPAGFYIIKITDTKTRLQLSKEFIVN